MRRLLALISVSTLTLVIIPSQASPHVLESVTFSKTVRYRLTIPAGVGESRTPVIFLVMNFSLKLQTYGAPQGGKQSGIARTEAFLQTTANCDNISASILAKAQVHGSFFLPGTVFPPVPSQTNASDTGTATGCNRAIALTDEASTPVGTGAAWWTSRHTGIASDIKWKDSSGTWRTYTRPQQEIQGSCTGETRAGGVHSGSCKVTAVK